MSSIDPKTIERLASLSQIQLSPEEIDLLTRELEAIVGFVEQLEAVEVADLPPTDQVTGLESVLREDEVRPGLSRDVLLANAPRTEDGYIVVPRVLG